jgi:hypothetical protein
LPLREEETASGELRRAAGLHELQRLGQAHKRATMQSHEVDEQREQQQAAL